MGSSLVRSLMVGAATGGRSFTGLCAVSLTSTAEEGVVGRPLVKVLTTLAAVGELVGDQLPRTPSRLGAPGLGARIVVGATSAGLLARRHGSAPIPQVAIGVGAAVAAAFAGHWLRVQLGDTFGSDVPGALIEDVVVAGLAYLACTGGSPAFESLATVADRDDRPGDDD